MIMAEHLDTVGQSGQLVKTTLSTDYPHQDYKRQGGQLGHPFSGVDPRKKITISKKMSVANNTPKKTVTLHSAS